MLVMNLFWLSRILDREQNENRSGTLHSELTEMLLSDSCHALQNFCKVQYSSNGFVSILDSFRVSVNILKVSISLNGRITDTANDISTNAV